MLGEHTWSELGSGGVGEDADVEPGLFGRSARLPVWVSHSTVSNTAAVPRNSTSASPRSTSPPACSPLAERRAGSAFAWEALRGGLGASSGRASPTAMPGLGGSPRTDLLPPRVSPVAQVAGSFLSLPAQVPLHAVSSAAAAGGGSASQVALSLAAHPVPPSDPCAAAPSPPPLAGWAPARPTSRHTLRLGIGAFCLLNAAIAFLFAWMMRTHQTAFAITAARRKWDLAQRADATVKAGLYYALLALVLLVDRLSRLAAQALQLVLRAVHFCVPLLRRLCRWAARTLTPRSRGSRGAALRDRGDDDEDDDGFGGHGVVTDEAAPLVRARNVSQFLPSSFTGPGAAPSGSPTTLSASRMTTRLSGVAAGMSTAASAQGSMQMSTPVAESDVRVRVSPMTTPSRWRGA